MTVKYEIEAIDDLEAREIAKIIKESLPIVLPRQTNKEIKFQQIRKDKEPKRIEI